MTDGKPEAARQPGHHAGRCWLPGRDLLLSILACLLALIVFTLAWGDAWLLDYGYADNWSYVKYFADWTTSAPVLRTAMSFDYKGSRVAWILPGFLAYHLFGPLGGSIVLNLTFAVVSVVVTLVVISRLFDRTAAVLATIIVSADASFYASGAPNFWSYHGVICNVFYTLFLLTLAELARRPGQWIWGVSSGLTCALTVMTTTTYVVALPSALIFWLLLRGRPTLREILVIGLQGSLGAAFGIVLLAAVNVLVGGPPLFMLPLLRATLRVAGQQDPQVPLAAWLPQADWLIFPFLVAVGGALALGLQMRGRASLRTEQRRFIAAFVSFLMLWATEFVFELRGDRFLQVPQFQYMVIGPAALALGGMLQTFLRSTVGKRRLTGSTYVLLAGLLTIPQVVLGPILAPLVSSQLDGLVIPWHLSAAMVASALLGMVALAFLMRGVTFSMLVCSGLCLGVAWTLVNPYRGLAATPEQCRVERDNFLLVTDVAGWLGSQGWHADSRSWFSRRDVLKRADGCDDVNLFPTFLAIEQAAMVPQVTSPLPLPERIIDFDPMILRNQVEANRRPFLIILSQPDLALAWDAGLIEWASQHQVYIRARPIRRATFTRGPLSITVQVYGTGQRARRFVPGESGSD